MMVRAYTPRTRGGSRIVPYASRKVGATPLMTTPCSSHVAASYLAPS